ncbi:hypothetical protein [Mesorhizobium sp. M1399]|uniref:hypothetical protein n=1 Tax=Mesorhizobium sp. M1399 TaxID=2957096 RepID=UPI003338042C
MKKISHLLVLTAICTITAAMAPAGAAYAQNAPYWRADWEEGPCTGASCYTDWSFVQAENPAEADPSLNAIISGLVSTGAGNVSSHGGNSFGKFETTLAAINAGKPHSKVYRSGSLQAAWPRTTLSDVRSRRCRRQGSMELMSRGFSFPPITNTRETAGRISSSSR